MRKLLPIILILTLMIGCSMTRKGAVKLTDVHIENVETAKEIADQLNKAWPVTSGFLTETLEYNKPDIDVESYDRIMAIVAKRDEINAKDEMSDNDKGRVIALSWALVKELTEQAVKGVTGIVKSIIGLIGGI